MDTLYHLTTVKDWEQALANGIYTVSTRGKQFAEDGYIHLSFADQVKGVADFLYTDVSNVVLLRIAPEKLLAQVVIEVPVGGSADDEAYPHLYGPLNIEAVVAISSYSIGADGLFPPVTR